MGVRSVRSGSKSAGAAEPGRRPRRRGGGLVRGFQAAPWLALAIMIALWPGSPEHRQSRLEAKLLEGETDRGRKARSPREIPHKGWSDVLWRTWKEFNDDR